MRISTQHPRHASLIQRHLLIKGVENGTTSLNGLIAQGRGEAFDYLLGEKTHSFAKEAIEYAAQLLVQAKHPVISVNGNTAALVPQELIQLGKLLHAPLEINLFTSSQKRIKAIENHLRQLGSENVLRPDKHCILPHISSPRKYVNHEGIFQADVVFVPLEDGDRAEALIKNGKKVITVDLNPLSRTAQMATVTIVDNVTRALPLLIKDIVKRVDQKFESNKKYNNQRILRQATLTIREVV